MRALTPARWLPLAIPASWRCRTLWVLIFQPTQVSELFREVFLLCPAALPAVTPIEDEELEAESIDLDGWLEADAQVVVVHLVEL
jgi:hypothetical protein